MGGSPLTPLRGDQNRGFTPPNTFPVPFFSDFSLKNPYFWLLLVNFTCLTWVAQVAKHFSFWDKKPQTPLCRGKWGGRPGALRGSNSNFIESKNFKNKSCQLHYKGDKNTFIVTFWPPGVSTSKFIKSYIFTYKSCQAFFGDEKNPNSGWLTRSAVWSRGCHGYFLVTYKTNLAV